MNFIFVQAHMKEVIIFLSALRRLNRQKDKLRRTTRDSCIKMYFLQG
jgi:hypothetical protein